MSDLIKVYLVCYLCNFSAFFFCLRRVLRFLHVQTKAGNLRRTEEGSEGRRQGRTTRFCGNTARRTNEMDKKAGGEADPEAMRLHIINSCLFALDPSPGCTS